MDLESVLSWGPPVLPHPCIASTWSVPRPLPWPSETPQAQRPPSSKSKFTSQQLTGVPMSLPLHLPKVGERLQENTKPPSSSNLSVQLLVHLPSSKGADSRDFAPTLPRWQHSLEPRGHSINTCAGNGPAGWDVITTRALCATVRLKSAGSQTMHSARGGGTSQVWRTWCQGRWT